MTYPHNEQDAPQPKLGALWQKNTASGSMYFSGSLDVSALREALGEAADEKYLKVVIFANRNKKQEKHPDFEILKSRPKGEAPRRDISNNRSRVDDDDSIQF